MLSAEVAVAAVMMVSLIVYALLGGADYGGGVWDLLASGPRAREQRALIADAIGPVWEANHVWLILVVVLLFSGFPAAFAAISTALHVPLTLMLIGVVLRGSAFTFRTYDSQRDDVQRRWGRTFAIASVVTPVLLGVVVGAVTSGAIRFEGGRMVTGFFAPWLAPFPFAVGFFALALFAFLAAVYLTVEAPEPALKEDFRRRALWAAVAVGALALATGLLAAREAPRLVAALTATGWALPLHLATGAAAVAALWALWARRFGVARVAAALQVALILAGWGAAQYPYLVYPDVTVAGAAAPAVTLGLLLWALGAGAFLLLPSLYYLYRVFKATPPASRGSRADERGN